MKLRFLIGLSTLMIAHIAEANLYHCSGSQGKPTKNTTSIETDLAYVTSAPYINEKFVNSNLDDSKKPFLIYYAIDSSEAFMQYTVRYELAKLQESCSKSEHVNFAGIINSLYVEKNQILICKNKKISYINVNQFPKLDSSLKIKRKFISSGDHTEEDLGPLSYRVLYPKVSNKPFGMYPLAHPDFLHDLINLVIEEKTLFPSSHFSPFINLKSHGSKKLVLAGMHECQSNAKILSANKIVESVLTKQELKLVRNSKTIDSVLANISTYEKAISKLELGNNLGNDGSGLGGSRLGGSRLGGSRLNIGDAFSGLGVHEGLGTEFGFGTYHVQLNWVLQDLFESGSAKSLGFLMLESCDTNRDPELFHSYLDNVLGYYSAKHSLWYRNLNWWEILEKGKGSTAKVIQIIKEETPKIKNIEVISTPL